jgi:hypothetical protein
MTARERGRRDPIGAVSLRTSAACSLVMSRPGDADERQRDQRAQHRPLAGGERREQGATP